MYAKIQPRLLSRVKNRGSHLVPCKCFLVPYIRLKRKGVLKAPPVYLMLFYHFHFRIGFGYIGEGNPAAVFTQYAVEKRDFPVKQEPEK
jgi:hypothetical protein